MKTAHPGHLDLSLLEDVGLHLMREIASEAKRFFFEAPSGEDKGDGSQVSIADKTLELKARAYLAGETPTFGFAGEEFGRLKTLSEHHVSLARLEAHKKKGNKEKNDQRLDFELDLNEAFDEILNLNEDTYWVFDPIDGTSNFLVRSPLWTHLLALVVKGEPVLGVVAIPMIDEVFVASRGNGARFGALSLSKSELRPCYTRAPRALQHAHLSVSSPQYFSRRGIESWYQELLSRKGDLRTHSDAYGYTRILCGGIDAQIDPMAFPHDIAALQVLFDETENAYFTTLQGHTGASRFQRGSMLAASCKELALELLENYYEHLHGTMPASARHMSPQDFTQKFLLDHDQIPFASHPNETRQWARALETSVAMFRKAHPSYLVEDLSIIAAATDSASVKVKNGAVDAPPRRRESVGLAIRAVVGGGTGLVTSVLPEEEPKVTLISRALELAREQSILGKKEPGTEILSYRDHVHSHLGPMPWGQRVGLEAFHDLVQTVAKNQNEKMSDLVQTVETSVALSTENRMQIFLDGSQHSITFNTVQFNNVVTAVDGKEKRRARHRVLENRDMSVAEFANLQKESLSQTKQHAIDMLKAKYVPEDVPYDYLVIGADLMGLILHEAVGHAAEGDLIATGQSGFGKDGVLQPVQVGPDWLSIAIDGNLDNCGLNHIDAEGTLARRKWIVRDGILTEAIHTRETARAAGGIPDGCARIESVFHPSLNRMTSIWVQAKKLHPLSQLSSNEDLEALSPKTVYQTLVDSGYLKKGQTILYLSGWKGGTASCSNLEFRADVERIYLLRYGEEPILMREANFTGIATECFKSAVAAFGPVLCRTIGICGKDGQGVPTSDGGPAVMLFKKHPMVRVIGSGEAAE